MSTWKKDHKIDALVINEGGSYYVASPPESTRLIPFDCTVIQVKPEFYEYLRENLLDSLVQIFLEYKFNGASQSDGRT